VVARTLREEDVMLRPKAGHLERFIVETCRLIPSVAWKAQYSCSPPSQRGRNGFGCRLYIQEDNRLGRWGDTGIDSVARPLTGTFLRSDLPLNGDSFLQNFAQTLRNDHVLARLQHPYTDDDRVGSAR
jgi:hypothetical protein